MIYKKNLIIFQFALLLLYSGLTLFAQEQISVEDLSKSLNQALIESNDNQLVLLLNEDLSFGHSNGWVENKEELIRNNQSKYLVYEKISMDSKSVKSSDNTIVLRFQSITDAILNGKRISLKLHVCQVWIKTKGKWKLLVRQSTQIN